MGRKGDQLDYQATHEDDMPTNEEGEFELVLGNKQLLSVFFVAVLLLGVFFIMGYIVGRNLSPEPVLVAEGSRPPDITDIGTATNVAPPKSTEPEPEKPSASVKPPEPRVPPTVTKSEPVKPEPIKQDPPKTAETKPIVPVAKPVEAPKKVEPPKPEPTKKAEATKKEATKKAEVVKPTPKPVELPKPPAAKPAAGSTYLQVAAAAPDKVPGFVKNLTSKGFQVITQPVPDSELVRVLVGPFDASAATDGAAKLKAAGFDSIRKKL